MSSAGWQALPPRPGDEGVAFRHLLSGFSKMCAISVGLRNMAASRTPSAEEGSPPAASLSRRRTPPASRRRPVRMCHGRSPLDRGTGWVPSAM